ncbi:MAG TPA: protein-L-isoaspartate(D-aspartate) O-methyltransferase [Candidatus Ozemobacteraceae bacterium]|nr:protein-L-isoaspartate(D-aspartate) O-methyltransferase [Candidatus Ozemobacteraceae bacterium]
MMPAKTGGHIRFVALVLMLVVCAFMVKYAPFLRRGTLPAGGSGVPVGPAVLGVSKTVDVSLRADGAPSRSGERVAMVETIRGYGMTDETILCVMAAVPRHEFVPFPYGTAAYDDSPLPIGYGQTISQPYIVAEMTRLLRLASGAKVLEIGTSSGYQAAVLAELGHRVWTVEIIRELAESAAERLGRLGYGEVRVRHADGYHGWPSEAPFDGIIVTCAAGEVPPPLIDQLATGGRMVIPVGAPFSPQWLLVVFKGDDGSVTSEAVMGVRFVPLVRKDEVRK